MRFARKPLLPELRSAVNRSYLLGSIVKNGLTSVGFEHLTRDEMRFGASLIIGAVVHASQLAGMPGVSVDFSLGGNPKFAALALTVSVLRRMRRAI